MKRLLVDTHTLVWWLSDVALLSERAQAAITDPWNDVFVSAVTGWEVATKRLRGLMRAPADLSSVIEAKGFSHLPLTFQHAEQAAALPMYHRDPFDRFLIAQAQLERLTLVTRHRHIPQYGVDVLRA